jgi:hypothetical protein
LMVVECRAPYYGPLIPCLKQCVGIKRATEGSVGTCP